jgi:hypothetical protein
MTTSHGLKIILRIPVRVIDDTCISLKFTCNIQECMEIWKRKKIRSYLGRLTAVKVIPSPPARVLSKNINVSLSFSEYRSMAAWKFS